MGELSGGVGGRSGVILIVPTQGLGISIKKKLNQVLGVFERCISSYVHSFRVLGISTHIYASTKLTFSYIISPSNVNSTQMKISLENGLNI